MNNINKIALKVQVYLEKSFIKGLEASIIKKNNLLNKTKNYIKNYY